MKKSDLTPLIVTPLIALRRYKQFIPWALILLRLSLAPFAIIIVWLELPRWVWVSQFIVAIASDIYDGKLARLWGVASEKLRRADSIADAIYAFACLACFWLAEPQIVFDHILGIATVVLLDLLRTPLDWFLFRKRASYHSISTRLFGISLIPVGILIMVFGEVYWLLWISLFIGIFAELEGIAISLILPKWVHDIKHIGVAIVIRREFEQRPNQALKEGAPRSGTP